jgi:uncharacterized protein YuzE
MGSTNSLLIATLLLIIVQQNQLAAVYIPEVRIPEVRIPEIRSPGVWIPEIRIPEIWIPEIRIPEIPNPKMPEFTSSSISHQRSYIYMGAGSVFSCSVDTDNIREYVAIRPLENGSVPGIECVDWICKLNCPAGMTSTTIKCSKNGGISVHGRGRIIPKEEMLCKEDQ